MNVTTARGALLLVVCGVVLIAGSASAQVPNFSVSGPITVNAGTDAGLQAVAVGDVNNDQHADIVSVAADADGGPLAVLINNGDGTFVEQFVSDEEGTLLAPIAVAIADVGATNGGPDGNPDLIVIEEDAGFIVAFGDGAGNFTIEGDVTEPEGVDVPVGLAVGNFDGQNGPDFAIIDEEGPEDNGQVHFFCNAGTAGIFNPCDTPSLDSGGTVPIDVGVGDFNGDSQLDVIVLNQGDESGQGNIALFIGGGNGTFTLPAQETFSLPRVPQDLAIGDLNPNEDSIDDVAVADDDVLGEDNVTVFYGGTSGAILTRRSAVLELATTALTIGSFGGNSNPDLAGTNDGERADTANIIAVTTGNGTNDNNPFNNSSQVGATLSGGGKVIVTGRFDDDALDDVVVLSLDGDSVRVALNRQGSATATPGTPVGGSPTATPTPTGVVATPALQGCTVSIPVAQGAQALVKGDFNGDNNTDLAVLDGNGTNLVVLLINPSELTTIKPPATPTCQIDDKRPSFLGNTYTSLAAGLINNDDVTDLVVGGSNGVLALISRGDGEFDSVQVPAGGGGSFQSVAIGSFDSVSGGDVAAVGGGNLVIFGSTVDNDRIVFPQGGTPMAIAGAALLAPGDLDGDGKFDDLAVATASPNAAIILLGPGGGPFPPPSAANRVSFTGAVPKAITVVGSVSANRAGDVVVALDTLGEGSVGLIRRSNGALVAPTPRVSGGPPTALGAGNVVGNDQIADAVVGSTGGGGVAYFLPGNSDGTFAPVVSSQTGVGANPTGVVVVDIDGDGLNDVVVANSDSGILSLQLSTLAPPTPTPTMTLSAGPATNTPTRGPTGTPTVTPRSTPQDTATFKPGTFDLGSSSCSIGSGRPGEGSNGVAVLMGGVALIAMRLRRQRSK